ncbi:MAG: class I SAM-dependent methyltransferase [Bacteroidetes bacterium]|nr:class I SAM-dependent methyltransferase [Bacteroidota bacterium]
MKCRFCSTPLDTVFIDLINSPASNSFLTAEQLDEPEVYYPLKVYVCHSCYLVQVDEYKKSDDIFNADYVYFSSYSATWLAHAKQYTGMMIDRFGYNESSKVVEIASNDGYLLQYFKERGVPVLGIEPTANTAEIARQKGIESLVEFFGTDLATSLKQQGIQANLLLGNNVLAHVPDIRDFVNGLKVLLAPDGVITMEFPHLLQLVANSQFDTIYHEHFSYLSFYTVEKIFREFGLEMFDVEELTTHGGSLRIFARHAGGPAETISPRVQALLDKETAAGVTSMNYYAAFQEKAADIKWSLLEFLIEQKRKGKTVAAYGAAAKGNTLLNFCGVKNDLISFVADANPHKQGKYLPASHIPVTAEQQIKDSKPDYILILPWNLRDEISKQLHYVRDWGGQFVTPVPSLQIF